MIVFIIRAMDSRKRRGTSLASKSSAIALLVVALVVGALANARAAGELSHGFVRAVDEVSPELPPAQPALQAQTSRSLHLLPQRSRDGEAPVFDAAQSAGLFVGVRRFPKDPELAEVRYAVDDAIDLAFTLALDLDVRFLLPGRVKLALSGEPQKPESQQRLQALKKAGATVYEADQAEILTLLESQAEAAGRGGILVVAFATHGFSEEGNHYLVTASSLLRHRETMIRAGKVFDLAAHSAASRRLLFLDACRERLTADERGVARDPRSAASRALVDAIARARGQVIFSAAALGGYAFVDDGLKNGVFTAAVLDGLHCWARTDERGFITVETLASYVNGRVTTWRRQHRDPTAEEGIETNLGGSAAAMALAACSPRPPPASQPVSGSISESLLPGSPDGLRPSATVTIADRSFNVFDASGIRIWGREVAGTIAHAEVADLNGDGNKEVIVGVGAGGDDTGKIIAFSGAGERLWTADTTGCGPRIPRRALTTRAAGAAGWRSTLS